MIQGFACAHTAALFERRPRGDRPLPRNLHAVALRKLLQLDASEVLEQLRIPPGNRLEALKGDRQGRHSIRVNDQWRICFRWTPAGPDEVEIVDYH